jgi:hypothetical protein
LNPNHIKNSNGGCHQYPGTAPHDLDLQLVY